MKVIEIKNCGSSCPHWVECPEVETIREFATGRSFPKSCPLKDHEGWEPPNQEVENGQAEVEESTCWAFNEDDTPIVGGL